MRGPVVLGHGVGVFTIGRELYRDEFESLGNWVVQIQERSGFEPAKVECRDGTLDCLVPGRGCTVWFKEKLRTRVAITYDVICPTHEPEIEGVRPRDINQFWMASDPTGAADGLFDSALYTGAFKSYDKIHAYYASTGGGGAGSANRTTRMRRYPRVVDGRPAPHVALTDKDGRRPYLITSDRVMQVQLVAFDDVVQYIVDGRLVYQMRGGDRVQVEGRDAQGAGVWAEAGYNLDRFPVYSEGYFGFRMVGTHHVYSNFRVHALDPVNGGESRPTVRVDTLDQFREAIAESGQQIVVEPGRYVVPDREGFHFTGSDNDIDLTGVKIEVPLEVASGSDLFLLSGNRITLSGGEVEDTYPDGSSEVTDFGPYNRGPKFGGMNEMEITGDDIRVVGMKMTVRGSFPYGYGNMFGIGAGSAVRLRKHCGIQIKGNRAVVDGCQIKMEAFGHAIFVQGGDQTTVRNTVVEGTLRPSNDCYEEAHPEDLAQRFGYEIQWPENVKGIPIPRDHMLNCAEDGIRAYKGAGDMVVENCVVRKMRGGIKLYMAKSARVSDCQVLDCVIQGYSLPSRGTITRSSGNAAYGPLLYIHSDRHVDQQIDLTVLPAPHSLGDHPLAAIKGRGHSITFRRGDVLGGDTPRPVIVGYPMRFDFLSTDYPEVPAGYEDHFATYSPGTYTATGIALKNETPHPVVLGELSRGNTVITGAGVRDYGEENTLE